MVKINPEKVIHVKPKMIKENFNTVKHPDPKLHQRISFIKSAVRLLGYALIPLVILDINYVWVSASVLFISEFIGILEELV
jgi:hypothetical protein